VANTGGDMPTCGPPQGQLGWSHHSLPSCKGANNCPGAKPSSGKVSSERLKCHTSCIRFASTQYPRKSSPSSKHPFHQAPAEKQQGLYLSAFHWSISRLLCVVYLAHRPREDADL